MIDQKGHINYKGEKKFKELINQNLPANKKKLSRRGRCKNLIAERNKCLFYRFYYYSKILKLRYEDLLEVLGSEFFLSDRTVSNILQTEFASAKQVFKEDKSAKQLKKMYEFLNWNN